MYKLFNNLVGEIVVLNIATNTSFLTSVGNTDYANFKAQINADEAQLEDADGNLMTAEQAKEFVSTLP
jgi:hypothetical protein